MSGVRIVALLCAIISSNAPLCADGCVGFEVINSVCWLRLVVGCIFIMVVFKELKSAYDAQKCAIVLDCAFLHAMTWLCWGRHFKLPWKSITLIQSNRILDR